jgi:hypothetical protein
MVGGATVTAREDYQRPRPAQRTNRLAAPVTSEIILPVGQAGRDP